MRLSPSLLPLPHNGMWLRGIGMASDVEVVIMIRLQDIIFTDDYKNETITIEARPLTMLKDYSIRI
jgi:hypothetical protein